MWSVQDKNKDGHLQHRLISGLRVEVCLVWHNHVSNFKFPE
jgi:hypothetical protein